MKKRISVITSASLLASENVHYPDLQLLASQTDTAIGSSETSVWRRIVYGLISRLLLESLHLSDGREIKIIGRGQRYKYKWQTVYGKDTCYMPTANINDVIWEEEAQNTAVLNLTLQTSGGGVTYAFTRDNPSIPTYNQFLSTVTGSAVEMA